MLNKEQEERLKRAGLLVGKYDDYKRMYNRYKLEYSLTGSKMQAYVNTSEHCGYSQKTVERAVKTFSLL